MRQIKKIVCMLMISFICILIQNVSLAATTEWKSTRKFGLTPSQCTEHNNCTIYNTGSKTVHIGPNGYIGNSRLLLDKDKGVLCLQHNTSSDDEFAEKNLEIQYKMEIDDNIVKVIPISKEAKEKSGNSAITMNSKYSAQVAYVLSHTSNVAGGDERYENGTQGALWEVVPAFWKELEQNTSFDDGEGNIEYQSWIAKGAEITKEARQYGNFAKSNPPAPSKIDTTVKVTELDNNYYIIGPFKMKYASSSYTKDDGDVVQFAGFVSANLKMNNTMSDDDWSLCNKSGENIDEPDNNGNEFYIKVKKSKMASKGSLSINVKRMKVKADYFTMTSSTGYQENAVITLAQRYYESNTVTFDFETSGNLRIVKKDADNSKVLSGVKFKIKNSKGYVKAIDNNGKVRTSVTGIINLGNIELTGNKEEATEFITNEQGIIEIHNILIDTYTVEEVSVGEHYGYILYDSNITWEVEGKTGTGQRMEVVVKCQPPDKTGVSNTTVSDKYATILTVKNKKQVRTIHLIKQDYDDAKIPLGGVEYVLKSSYQNKYVKIKGTGDDVTTDADGWITRAVGTVIIDDTNDAKNNPTLTYTSNIEEATKFVTENEKGEIYIQNLITSSNGKDVIKYELEEIYNPNYGYTEMENVSIDGIKAGEKEIIYTAKNKKQVGEIYIHKIDDIVTDKKLVGVEFVLKSSYQNKYVKIKGTGDNVTNDADGWTTRAVGTVRIDDTNDVVNNPILAYTSNIEEATKFVTDSNAEIHIQNLLISSNGKDTITYQLEEVANPNYGYLINSEEYPKFEVNGTVTEDGAIIIERNQTTEVIVKNHQEYLRIEGYVWEEISTSKSNTIDNLYQDTDALIKGINVYLCRNGNVVATQVTDENGWYCFGTVRPQGESYEDSDYLTPENGNLEIDYLDQYYVEFEYDGLRFTSVEAIVEYLNEDYEITSKATEVLSERSDRKDRQSVNNDFSEIRYNASTKYALQYKFANNISTYIDYWGYEYNEDKTRLTVTPAEGYYEIIASTKTSGFDLKAAWEARCKDSGAEVLDGINLGIERRAQADLAISSDLNEVNIAVNTGTEIYENTYTYAKRNIDGDENTFGVETKFGTSTGSYSARGLNLYTRRIYESDLAYIDNKNNPELMKIYVTYKIRVKNQSTKLTSKVNEIVNYYDERYEIADSWLENGTKVNWTGNGGAGNGYKAGYTNAIANTELAPSGYIDIYIKFRLNNEAVKTLIQKQTTLNNVSEISAFSTVENGQPYAAIDEDSNPGSAQIALVGNSGTTSTTLNGGTYEIENKTLDTTTYEDDTDMAPSLILGIEEEDPTRGLSGTVFEDENSLHNDDNTHPGEERLGDGILGDDEKHRIVGAKVELLNEDGTLANLYQIEVTGGVRSAKEPETAATTTNEKGEYQFLGVIPGRYLIRYTYDANTYIVDENGNKIKDIDPRDYKSTIITSDLIKTALNLNKEIVPAKEERMGNLNWILPYEGRRYSDAVDDITKRESSDNVYYGNIDSTNLAMTADTAYFDVGVEYSDVQNDTTSEGFNGRVSFTDYKDEYNLDNGKILVLDGNGKLKLIDTFYAVNPYQDFGIVERPRQVYDVNKRVSDLKVTLANGQILINGNPYKTEVGQEYANWDNIEDSADPALQYVKALPGSVVAEIDNEIIQAAILNIEYTISIKNDSEKDYTETEYYYYGRGGSNQLTSVIKKVVDYMEDDLVYDEKQNGDLGWKKVTPEELHPWTLDVDNNNKQLISDEVYDSIKEGYTVSVTEIFVGGIAPGTAANVQIYGSKVLNTDENGIAVRNHVEIIETARHLTNPDPTQPSPTPGNYNPTTSSPNEPDDDQTSVSITPPTGLIDNAPLVITALAITLVVLAGGIYLIKKKVLE